MVVAGEGDATAIRMCSTKAANTDAAGMSTTDEHGDMTMSDTVAHLAAARTALMPWVSPQLMELQLARLPM
jgi:hypothetical protein